MPEEPAVIISLRPHLEVEYDLARRPNNKCSFPATPANVAAVRAQLDAQEKRVQAMEVLASS
jgi:hypothetical protein